MLTYKELYKNASPLASSPTTRVARNITAVQIGDSVVKVKQTLIGVMDFEATLPPELFNLKPTFLNLPDDVEYKPLKAIYGIQFDAEEELIKDKDQEVFAISDTEVYNLGSDVLKYLTKGWRPVFSLDEKNPYPPYYYELMVFEK